MNRIGRMASILESLKCPFATSPKLEHRQARLLARILAFLIVFCIVTLLIVAIFNPHHDPALEQYEILIGSLVIAFTVAYVANCRGRYHTAAILLIIVAMLTPWVSLLWDRSILEGDIIPLTYVTFAVLLSSILLPTRFTLGVALFQFSGIIVVLTSTTADASLNWFSLLAFLFLTSIFSILANNVIQRDMKQIADQAHQLALNEARFREQSIRGHLTNLFNRRYLEETLEREIQRVARKGDSLGVILLDVDRFKSINDTLGHAAGDTVIQELGKFLNNHIRQSDIACRLGGDEFVLVMPDASEKTTVDRAEQLRQGVNNLNLPATATISCGVAIFPRHGENAGTLLASADHALYQAKREGRNCVVVAE